VKQVASLAGSRPPGAADGPSSANAHLLALLDRYGDFLRRTIVRMCPPSLGLSFDDIEQDARVRLWQALRDEKDILYPGSYIYKVAVSATIKAIRRAKARREERLVDGEEYSGSEADASFHQDRSVSPEVLAEHHELIRHVEAALGRLAENRRLAVELHLRELTSVEIADLVGWSEPKARNLVYRGLRDLRRHLRAAGIEYAP
jgi:RNA polymerase sigma factor (sigma-70 family)